MKKIQYFCKEISVHDSRIIQALKPFSDIEIVETDFVKTELHKGSADLALISSLSLELDADWFSRIKTISFLSMGYELNEEIYDPTKRKIICNNLESAHVIVIDNPIHLKILKQEFNFNGEIYYLPYGCDIEVFSSIQTNNNRTIGINRPFTPHYNNQLAIQAVARLSPEDYGELVLVDYGDQEFFSKNKDLLKNIKLRKIKGHKPDTIRQFLEKTNIYVSASKSDGSSVSMLEAMAAGRLCVVSDHPCNMYWIENEKNGFVFKSQNEEDLYLTLVKTLNLTDERSNEIAEAARTRVSNEANWHLNSLNFARFLTGY